MSSVKVVLINGSSYTVDKDGPVKTEIFHITGLNPAKGDPQYQAYNAPGMPKYRQAHPTIPGIFAMQLRFDPFKDSKTKIKATVQFMTPERGGSGGGGGEGFVVRVSCSSQSTTTQFDADGDLIQVDYKTKAGQTLPSQYAVVPDLEDGTIIEFEKDLDLKTFGLWSTYRNRVSSQPFQGGKKRTWRCREVTGNSIDNLFNMRGAIRFEWRERGWDEVSFWRDAVTRTQPTDIAVDFQKNGKAKNKGNGWTRSIVRDEKDFRTLGFPVILKAP